MKFALLMDTLIWLVILSCFSVANACSFTLVGDFDASGEVDWIDYGMWEVEFGVDLVGSDFLGWQRNRDVTWLEPTGGYKPIGSPVPTAVPEPATIVVMSAALPFLLLRRRREL